MAFFAIPPLEVTEDWAGNLTASQEQEIASFVQDDGGILFGSASINYLTMLTNLFGYAIETNCKLSSLLFFDHMLLLLLMDSWIL